MTTGIKVFIFLLLPALIIGQTKTSSSSGLWNNPAIWQPAGVPGPGDDVQIADGTTVSITSTANCNNLTIGSGGKAALEFSGVTDLLFLVDGNIYVNNKASFVVNMSSNATHTLVLKGDIVNEGELNLATDNTSECVLVCNNNGDQNISGSGDITHFYQLVMHMGGNPLNVLDVSASGFSTEKGFLGLISGTFKLSSPAAGNQEFFGKTVTIAANAGIWINSATATVTTKNAVVLLGRMTVENGLVQVGTGNADELTCISCSVAVIGGTLDIAGKFNASSGANSNFVMSGGFLRVPTFNSNSSLIAPFEMSASNSFFSMTGGKIVIQRSGAANLGYQNLSSGGGAVTGGTIEIGDATSPKGQIIKVSSLVRIPNLTVNSSNVNAELSSFSETVTGNVTINGGTLSAGVSKLLVGGDWTSTGTFKHTAGNVEFYSPGTQIITSAAADTFNNVIFYGGIKMLGSSIAASGLFSITPGVVLDVSANNYSVAIGGDYYNRGTFNTRKGSVIMTGAIPQKISGTSVTDFYDLEIDNPSGVDLITPQRLSGSLFLKSGTFNTNNIPFTLRSDSSGTARIAEITGGDINGNVIIERYIPGGYTGWALHGSPIASHITFAEWDDDLTITCASCPDGYFNFTSMYTYKESLPGVFGPGYAYIGISSISDTLKPGVGYYNYLGTGGTTTTPITTDVTGLPVKGTHIFPLSYTNYNKPDEDGWNLIANPYPSPISWTALRNGQSSVDNAFYVYNMDLALGAGAYATFVNGVSSPRIDDGGIGDDIPMGQGLFIHLTGPSSFTVKESIKTAVNTPLLKLANIPVLRLELEGSGSKKDEAVIYFESAATNQLDRDYDAFELGSGNLSYPLLAFKVDSHLLQISGVPPVSGTFTTALLARTGVSGNYTISVSERTNKLTRACLTLIDTYNNTSTDLSTGSYTFHLADTTSTPRFILQLIVDPLQVTTLVSDPTCVNPAGGNITAACNGAGPWNYTWKKNSVILKTVMNSYSPGMLSNLNGGAYELEVYTTGKCDYEERYFDLPSKTPVFASFMAPQQVLYPVTAAVEFTNTSTNAATYLWDFGPGEGQSTDKHPSHFYTLPGMYKVLLAGDNDSGCKDTTYRMLEVIDPTFVTQLPVPGLPVLVKTKQPFRYEISGVMFSDNWSCTLSDTKGAVLIRKEGKGGEICEISLEEFSPGLYYFEAWTDKTSATVKLVR